MDECPASQWECGSGVGGELSCCAAAEQCCLSAEHGYVHDVCAPADSSCPVACEPDTKCAEGSYCEYVASTNTYVCADDCSPERTCGESVCCPLGSRCVGGACPLPDLTVDEDALDVTMTERVIANDDCTVVEECVGGPGSRLLLSFNTRTPNLGPGDLHLGAPDDNPLFVFSPCHGHHHFEGYASYELLDLEGNALAAGHKQAFCLLDLDCQAGLTPIYGCAYQGIRAGCADIYSKSLDCQWIDVTEVASGQYRLVIELNAERRIAEVDYTNNRIEVPVVVCRPAQGDCDDFSSCPGGCAEPSPSCCVAGDPCGLASDGVCDCDAEQAWDDGDCAYCDCKQ